MILSVWKFQSLEDIHFRSFLHLFLYLTALQRSNSCYRPEIVRAVRYFIAWQLTLECSLFFLSLTISSFLKHII